MTLARVQATGRGRPSARLVIGGLEYEFVSAKRMETTTADGRTRIVGLETKGIVIGASADLMRATLRGTSLTFSILDLDRIGGSRHGRVTRSLWRSPTVRCFLSGDVTTSDMTIGLRDATALPSSGVVHIGTEAISYSSRTAYALTVDSRALWQTYAQGHFAANGEGLSDALVTDQPIGIEGRRCYLYLYGDGDSPTGDGTLRWQGVCTSDVKWEAGRCSFVADPITRVFDQPLGGDLSSPVRIRGVTYTSASPWAMQILDVTTPGSELYTTLTIDGHYDDDQLFIDAANTAISAAISAAGMAIGDGAIYLERITGGYRVCYRSATASPGRLYATILSDLDYYPWGEPVTSRSAGWRADWGHGFGEGRELAPWGDTSWTVSADYVYSYDVEADSARATIGHLRGGSGLGRRDDWPNPDWMRLYIGGLVTPNANDCVTFGTGDDAVPARVYAYDSTTRRVDLLDAPATLVRLDSRSEIALGRNLATGNLLDVLDNLVSQSPGVCNTGAMPLLVGDDVWWESDVDDHVASQRLANGRGFYLFESGATLWDVLTPEMMVCGLYPRIIMSGSRAGRVELFRLAPPLTTDASTLSVDDTAGTRPTIEKSPRGVLSQVTFKVGYDPRQDEWDKRTITYRDVQSVSAVRTPITLTIAQRSTDTGMWAGSGTGLAGIDREDVARVAVQHLGLWGMPTAVVSLSLDARYMDAQIGDTVAISSSLLPDTEDGYSAITGRVGLVVGHSFDVSSGAVELAVLMHTQRFAGYAPAFRVTGQTNTSGNVWDIDVALTGYTDSTTVATYLAAGYSVRVSRADDDTADVTGTVTAIVDADTVTVTFGSAWTPGAYEWCLRSRTAGAYASTDVLSRYAFVAGDDRRVSYSDGDADAQVFS